jgi:hypothetical protein
LMDCSCHCSCYAYIYSCLLLDSVCLEYHFLSFHFKSMCIFISEVCLLQAANSWILLFFWPIWLVYVFLLESSDHFYLVITERYILIFPFFILLVFLFTEQCLIISYYHLSILQVRFILS